MSGQQSQTDMVEAYYRIRREVREESKTMWIAKFLFPLAKRFSSVAYSPLPRFPCAHLPPDSSPSTSTTAQQPPVVVAHNFHADADAVTAYCLRARNSPSTGLPTPPVDPPSWSSSPSTPARATQIRDTTRTAAILASPQ